MRIFRRKRLSDKASMWLMIFFLLSLFFIIPLWMYMGPTYEGDYKGRVVDAETGEPIEGVVVAGIWHKEIIDLAGGHSVYHDATEELTNKNGMFVIHGKFIKPANLSFHAAVFKSGYEGITHQSWESLKNNKNVSLNNTIIEIKLYKKHKKENANYKPYILPSSHAYNEGKIPHMIKEINKERKSVGFEQYPEIK